MAHSYFSTSHNAHRFITSFFELLYEAFLRFICKQKTFLSFLSFLLLSLRRLFQTMDPNLLYFLSYHEQCCLFEFSSLTVILKHSFHFINSIPYPMADPSHPFVLVLMTLVLKRDSLRIPNTFSISLLSPYLLSQTLSPIYFDQLIHHDVGEKPRFFPQ